MLFSLRLCALSATAFGLLATVTQAAPATVRDDASNTPAGFCNDIAASGGPQILTHPGSCTMFIVCENTNNPVPQECPAGLQFNPSQLVCDYPENVECDATQAPALLAAQQRAAYASAAYVGAASASAASASAISSSAAPSSAFSSSAMISSAASSSAIYNSPFTNYAWV